MAGKSKKSLIASNTTQKECPRCNKFYPISGKRKGFYSADEMIFPQGIFHICKNCVEEIVEENGFDAFIIILRTMNRPFLSDKYKGNWKDYLREVNSLPQYKDLTFDDSTFDNKDYKINKFSDVAFQEDPIEVQNITPEMRKRWLGFKDEDISQLESFYQDLINTYSSDTPIQRNLYKNMAITQLNANKAIAQNRTKEYKDLMDTMSKLMGDGNIKPVQESGVNDGGLATWGEWVKKIEETEPIPEPLEQFKDVDGIWKYISKWFVNHFAKVFGISNDNQADIDMLLDNGDANGRV
jgi:hypothetical protein